MEKGFKDYYGAVNAPRDAVQIHVVADNKVRHALRVIVVNISVANTTEEERCRRGHDCWGNLGGEREEDRADSTWNRAGE